MAEWSRIAPGSPIKEIEAQRKRVLDLREQIPKRREQRDQAAARAVEAERQDRERMAELMAAGKDAVPDVERVEQAKAEVAGTTRTAQALDLAVEAGEQQLHQLVVKHRADWTKRAERDVADTRTRAQEALATFQETFERHRHAQTVEMWLRDGSGLDRAKPPRPSVLGPAVGSANVAANGAPVDVGVVLGWLAEALDPKPPAASPGHERAHWPATGVAAGG